MAMSLITKLCLTLCNCTDYGPPGPSVHGISQARILEWAAFPSPDDLLDSRIQPASPALAGRFLTTVPPEKPIYTLSKVK